MELSQSTHAEVLGNNGHDLNQASTDRLEQGFYPCTDSNYMEMAWNQIENVKGRAGIQIHSSPVSSGNGYAMYAISIHDNLIYNIAEEGIIVDTVDPSKGAVTVYNNVVYNVARDGNSNGAIYRADSSDYDTSQGVGSGYVDFYNNTIFAFNAGPGFGDSFEVHNGQALIDRLRNNIVLSAGGPYLYVSRSSDGSSCSSTDSASACPNLTGSNNLLYGAGAATFTNLLTGSINANPLLASSSLGDAHLQVGSPAVAAGVAIPGLMADVEGKVRPQSGAIDVGAYQYASGSTGGSPTPTPPPTSTPPPAPPPLSGCNYSLGSAGASFAPAGGNGTVSLTATTGCEWSIAGAPSWIGFPNGADGTSSAAIAFQVLPNAGASRSATFTVESLPFTVVQGSSGTIAQIAAAGGWDTTLTLVNLGPSAADLALNFFSGDGSPSEFPFTFPQQNAQSPVTTATLRSDARCECNAGHRHNRAACETAITGWSQLFTAGAIDGFSTFGYEPTGQAAMVPLETSSATSYLLAFDNTGQIATGVAIANLDTFPVSVSVIIRDDMGALLGNGSIGLAAQGHNSFMLSDESNGFPATAGVRGTVEFDTPQPGDLALLGLRANGSALTTLPVFASVGAGGGSMAQVVCGGGWQTTFVLVNSGSTGRQPLPELLRGQRKRAVIAAGIVKDRTEHQRLVHQRADSGWRTAGCRNTGAGSGQSATGWDNWRAMET